MQMSDLTSQYTWSSRLRLSDFGEISVLRRGQYLTFKSSFHQTLAYNYKVEESLIRMASWVREQ